MPYCEMFSRGRGGSRGMQEHIKLIIFHFVSHRVYKEQEICKVSVFQLILPSPYSTRSIPSSLLSPDCLSCQEVVECFQWRGVSRLVSFAAIPHTSRAISRPARPELCSFLSSKRRTQSLPLPTQSSWRTRVTALAATHTHERGSESRCTLQRSYLPCDLKNDELASERDCETRRALQPDDLLCLPDCLGEPVSRAAKRDVTRYELRCSFKTFFYYYW